MSAFSQDSSVGAVGSPASECQSSPPLSPPGGSGGRAKRQIPHEDRELSEIKKRMWGLRVHCETEAAAAAVPLEGVVEEGEEEGAAVEMESDDDGQKEEEEVGEAVDGGTPMVRSDSQESSASTSSTGSGGGKISDDDPLALMLRTLYTRRVEPKDRVEAKIESLIRASLRRASAAGGGGVGGSSGGGSPVALPLALCDAPWREVDGGSRGGGTNGGGGGDMDTSPDPSDMPGPSAAALLGCYPPPAGGLGDDGGMDL